LNWDCTTKMSSKPENKYRKETKHFCKFCKIFIQNNLIQITRHEKEPGHLRRMSRLIDSINKTTGDTGSRESAKPKQTSINPLLYGLGQDPTADIPFEDGSKRNLKEFKTTEAFEQANPKLVLSANLPSAWQVCEEEDLPKDEIDLSLNTEMKKVKDDDEHDDEDVFKVVPKTIPVVDNGLDEKLPMFKKKKLKSKLAKK
jgi:hypothetical protein